MINILNAWTIQLGAQNTSFCYHYLNQVLTDIPVTFML